MRPTRSRASWFIGAVAAGCLTVGLTACDGSPDAAADTRSPASQPGTPDPPTSGPTSTDASKTSGTTPSADPATSPSPTDGTTTPPVHETTPPTHDTSTTARAKRSQIPRDRLPGFNATWTWDASHGAPGPPPSGPASPRCLRTSMTAIGGVAEYSTTYTSNASPQGADAAMVTTTVFPDEHTAHLAESVLSTWLRTCRAYVATSPDVDTVRVSDDQPVSTVVGTGHQRVVTYGPVAGDSDSMYFSGEGYVRDGDVISYVVFHNVGQDYDYEDGQQPADRGLRVAATYLKRSR